MLREEKITQNVLEMMVKQCKLNECSVSINTIATIEMYIHRLKKLDIEIKVLSLQNPECLPEGVTRENYDTFYL